MNASRCDVVIVPETSHNLKPVKSLEEAGYGGDVVPAVLHELCVWLKAHLAAGG